MKTTTAILRGMLLGAALIAVSILTGCVTTDVTTTAPDGTVTHTITKGPDAESVNAASAAVAIATRIIAEK